MSKREQLYRDVLQAIEGMKSLERCAYDELGWIALKFSCKRSEAARKIKAARAWESGQHTAPSVDLVLARCEKAAGSTPPWPAATTPTTPPDPANTLDAELSRLLEHFRGVSAMYRKRADETGNAMEYERWTAMANATDTTAGNLIRWLLDFLREYPHEPSKTA